MFCLDMILSVVAFTIAGNVVAADTSLSSDEEELCTLAHNKLRALHVDTQPLEWDESLAAKAQLYAEELVRINQRTSRIKLVHEGGDGLGENLYWMDNQKKGTCAGASLAWYIEIDDYDYRTAESKNGKAVGHFTQLVWRDTRKFGVGMATMTSRLYSRYGNTETFVVAKYSPRGNFHYTGQRFEDYSRNVQPRKAGSITPTIEQLQPTSATHMQHQTTCKNAAGDEKCDNFVNLWGYQCRGDDQYEIYFKEKCSKKCGYC